MASPIQDKIAIVGVASTGFSRHAGRSQASLALEACTSAIADAGLGKEDIDGVVGTLAPPAPYMVGALGLPAVTFYGNQRPTFVFSLMAAMQAIFSGACEAVVAYNAVYRVPGTSRSAAKDPFRRHLAFGGLPIAKPTRSDPEEIAGAVAYTAWASRYLHETGVTRDQLGYVAVNGRTNAQMNPLAAMRDPMTMEDYLGARMIRDPLCLYDMDVPVDGADAFVLTSAERAKDLPRKPVIIHAASSGITAPTEEAQMRGLRDHGHHVAIKKLRESSELWLEDADVYFPYDGFSTLTMAWFENAGWCGFGEAGDFIEDAWDESTGRILINGRIPVNTHGGQLSEGATQGSGHIREAVTQLRGDAGERQREGAKTALLTIGGFFHNAQGLVLRTD